MRRTLALVLSVGLAAGCLASPAVGAGSPSVVELSVFAAASLRDALDEVAVVYEASTPGVALTIVTDSSATLRTQIEEGAPADIFLSADQRHPQTLVDAGLADGEAVTFASSPLTIIVPSDNPADIDTPADLAKPGVKVVAAGDEVPVTTYAEQAIANLAADPRYPSGFAAGYAANVVSREDNVRAVVARIELGEGDAAIVYVTDAKVAAGVRPVSIPAAANVSATYAGVVVAASSHATEAHALLDWLIGPDGMSTLAAFGFAPPS